MEQQRRLLREMKGREKERQLELDSSAAATRVAW
jgi:hypothetical protein